MRSTSKLVAATAAISLVSSGTLAGQHPRIVIDSNDLPRLRFQCGVGRDPGAMPEWGPFGAHTVTFQKLRQSFVDPVLDVPLPGEVLAAAFVALLERDQAAQSGALRVVEQALAAPDWISTDPLELVIACEWLHDALPAEIRREFMLAARERAAPLAREDSPLDPRRFRERLFGLALAVAVDETDDPSPSWRVERKQLLEAAREYLALVLPNFVRWRGLSPTSPSAGPDEELLTALLVELGSHVVERPLWPDYRETVGRWLEHYELGLLQHPALRHNFARDDGPDAPLTPTPRWSELLPLTAPLIAARSGDPAAAAVARRTFERGADVAESGFWRWATLALATQQSDRPLALTSARNLGGSVVFRGGSGADATAIWVDSAQPYLRNRQHLDAGHFLITRGGRLTVGGGEDIALEAVSSKRGEQRLGSERAAFDFDDYTISTIAHNSIVCWDPAFVSRCGDRPYLPAGGQRCIGDTCVDFKTPLEKQGRSTGTQLAYGQVQRAAFLALDLTAAYDARVVKHYERRFVYCLDHVLIVVDSIELTSGRSPPSWVLNIPARPTIDGKALADDQRVAGETNDGGIWRVDNAAWLRWADRDGSLWMNPLAPTERRVRIVGGPAKSLTIPDGAFAGRAYVGGDPNSFERLIIPGERRGAANAWYRLGAPTLLGPLFGQTPHWGRIEIEPAALSARSLFVTVLVTDRSDADRPPVASAEIEAGTLRVVVAAQRETAELVLDGGESGGGTLTVRGRAPLEWRLPTSVEADPPLAPAATQPARD